MFPAIRFSIFLIFENEKSVVVFGKAHRSEKFEAVAENRVITALQGTLPPRPDSDFSHYFWWEELIRWLINCQFFERFCDFNL